MAVDLAAPVMVAALGSRNDILIVINPVISGRADVRAPNDLRPHDGPGRAK